MPSPCPRCLWSLPAPTRLHHFLPGRRAQGKAVRAGKPGGRHPPPLTRLSPVTPRPATCLAATHLLSRPICSQGSHQSHFTKATLLTGHLPSAGHYPQHQTNQFCPPSSAPLLAARGQCVVSPGRYSQPSIDWHQPPLRAKLYHSSELQQEQLFTLHLQAFLKLHLLPENHSILPGMSYVPLPPGSLP